MSALRVRQEDLKFRASLGLQRRSYIVRHTLHNGVNGTAFQSCGEDGEAWVPYNFLLCSRA